MLNGELELIKEKIDAIKKLGHGEVVVKIKNGIIYRILVVEDRLITK